MDPDGGAWRGTLDARGAYPVSSGDAFLAGLVVARERGEPWPAAMRLALGAAAASAELPGAGVLDGVGPTYWPAPPWCASMAPTSVRAMAMSEVFVARQPIFDLRLTAVGYELLFRAGHATTAVVTDPEGATATVVLNSFTELGLERIVGTRPAWINVSRDFILHGFARSVPPELVLLEILEDQLIDEELVAAIRSLKQSGYRLALDDFTYHPSLDPLLELADVVKLDFVELGRENLAREVRRLRPYGVTLLAEKLESREDFTFCAEAGCELFQGYFFCRPELLTGRAVDANRLSLLALLAALEDPAIELPDLERTIARDLGLSYRLLIYINSAFFGLRQQVRSIGQALALLGVHNLKQWAALTVFASIETKPAELTLTALIRARFCELSGGGCGATPASCSPSGCSPSSTRSWTSRWKRCSSASRLPMTPGRR